MNWDRLNMEIQASSIDVCSRDAIPAWVQRQTSWKMLPEQVSVLIVICSPAFASKLRSVGLERKVGDKLHLKLNICLRPIGNKYYEVKMQRTLIRE